MPEQLHWLRRQFLPVFIASHAQIVERRARRCQMITGQSSCTDYFAEAFPLTFCRRPPISGIAFQHAHRRMPLRRFFAAPTIGERFTGRDFIPPPEFQFHFAINSLARRRRPAY